MTVHVIGAGIAGLAAALRLAGAGRQVRLYEATAVAGGRCRSYRDPRSGATLNSGIHIFLPYQHDLHRFLAAAGAPALRRMPIEACGFLDCEDGVSWQLRPGAGRLPWWLLDPDRRIPGTSPADLMSVLRLALADPLRPLAEVVRDRGAGWRRFWEPFCIAVLNTPPAQAAVGLLRPFLGQVTLGGADGRDLLLARDGLTASLIAPALARLAEYGVTPAFRQSLQAIEIAGGRVTALRFPRAHVPLARGDGVVLALPPRATERLLPSVAAPPASGIVVAHFHLAEPRGRYFATLLAGQPLWLLVEGRSATVTVGAANALLPMPAALLAARLWSSVARALDLPPEAPPARVLKFRDGTYLHSPEAERAKPEPSAGLANLRLAGDWILPGMPAGLGSAVRSAHLAAEALLAQA